MLVLLISQFAGSILSSLALHYQRRYNALHNSVYGLSYDTTILSIVKSTVVLYTVLSYQFNPEVRHQLYARFPLFYNSWDDIPVSTPLLFAEGLLLLSHLRIWRQMSLYKRTRHTHQGFSLIALMFLSLFIVVPAVLTLYLAYFNIYHFAYLDHLNIMWVMAQIVGSLVFCSQICINWMGSCCAGVSSRSVMTLCVANAVRWLGYMFTVWTGSVEFWAWPFNATPIVVVSADLLGLFLIFYQAQFIYFRHKPTLPKQSLRKSSFV